MITKTRMFFSTDFILSQSIPFIPNHIESVVLSPSRISLSKTLLYLICRDNIVSTIVDSVLAIASIGTINGGRGTVDSLLVSARHTVVWSSAHSSTMISCLSVHIVLTLSIGVIGISLAENYKFSFVFVSVS